MEWNLFPRKRESLEKVIQSNGQRSIEKTREGRIAYAIRIIPTLSIQELELLREAVECYHFTQQKPWDATDWMKRFCGENHIELDESQQQYLSTALSWELDQFGALTPFMSEEGIEEIALIGARKRIQCYHSAWGWMESNAYYESDSGIKNAVNKWCRESGRRLSTQQPQLNATLSNGFRLSANMAPVTQSVNATVRKFRSNPFKPKELVSNQTISGEALAFLSIAMRLNASALVAGNTGSGKTTTLNALFDFVPREERVIVVEETPELRLPQDHVIRLKAVPNQGIGLSDLVTQTLRMRPDRVVVGEVRNNAEAQAFTDTLLAGQGRSSYATFHAQSAGEALQRFEHLGVPVQELSALDLIVLQKRHLVERNGFFYEKRSVTQVCELLCVGKEVRLNELYSMDWEKRRLSACGESARVFEKAKQAANWNRKKFNQIIQEKSKEFEPRAVESNATTAR